MIRVAAITGVLMAASAAHAQTGPGFPFPFGEGIIDTKVFHYQHSANPNDWMLPAFGSWVLTPFGTGGGHTNIFRKELPSTWLTPIVFADLQAKWANNETHSACLSITLDPAGKALPVAESNAYQIAAQCTAVPSGEDVTITINAHYLAHPPAGNYVMRLWAFAYPDSSGGGQVHYTFKGATQVQIDEVVIPQVQDPEWWTQ